MIIIHSSLLYNVRSFDPSSANAGGSVLQTIAQRGTAAVLRRGISIQPITALGHSRPRRQSQAPIHACFAPKANVADQNVIRRLVPTAGIGQIIRSPTTAPRCARAVPWFRASAAIKRQSVEGGWRLGDSSVLIRCVSRDDDIVFYFFSFNFGFLSGELVLLRLQHNLAHYPAEVLNRAAGIQTPRHWPVLLGRSRHSPSARRSVACRRAAARAP